MAKQEDHGAAVRGATHNDRKSRLEAPRKGSRARRPRPVLRAITYLAPSIPYEFFELVTDYLERALGCRVVLDSESRISGPMCGDVDPFAEGRADIGFLCSPSYLYLRAQMRPSVDLVPAGFVFRDPRHGGEPVYFSDVVVRADHPARQFEHLSGCAWGFNDESSLSGYFATLQRLMALDRNADFFSRRVRTGSHLASIEATLSGIVDATSVDSIVFAQQTRLRPELASQLRRLDSIGPLPVQPVVARSDLASSWKARIAEALLTVGVGSGWEREFARFGLDRCSAIDDATYAAQLRALRALGEIPPTSPARAAPPARTSCRG